MLTSPGEITAVSHKMTTGIGEMGVKTDSSDRKVLKLFAISQAQVVIFA